MIYSVVFNSFFKVLLRGSFQKCKYSYLIPLLKTPLHTRDWHCRLHFPRTVHTQASFCTPSRRGRALKRRARAGQRPPRSCLDCLNWGLRGAGRDRGATAWSAFNLMEGGLALNTLASFAQGFEGWQAEPVRHVTV